MKTIFYILCIFVLISGCKDRDAENNTPQLPPETQMGANTFGVTIKGKVYVPRDPTGSSTMPNGKGMMFWRSPDNEHSYDELEVIDGASSVGFKIVLHIYKLFDKGKGIYLLKESNFQNGIDSIHETHIFFKVWDPNIGNYAYYGSTDNQGEINVKRYDFDNRIFSGTFSGRFVRNDNSNDIIEITDGRFDINWNTLPDHPFP